MKLTKRKITFMLILLVWFVALLTGNDSVRIFAFGASIGLGLLSEI